MSNALAISGITAVLQYYLTGVYSGLSAMFGSTPTVSSQAPDILQNAFSSGGTKQNQVNIFLHQVTAAAALRIEECILHYPAGVNQLDARV